MIRQLKSDKKWAFWIIIVVASLALAMGIGVSNRSSMDLAVTIKPTDQLELSVSQAILDHSAEGYYSMGECAAEGHVILKVQEEQGLTTVFMVECYGNFGFENGIFTVISGHGYPSVVTFSQNQQGQYQLEGYKVPLDGAGYGPSLQELFPADLHSLLQEDYSETMDRQLERYGKAYLKQIGRDDAQVQASHVDKQLANINVEVSNYLLNAYGDYPYWLGTLETVEDGVRYVYEKQWQDSGGGDGVVTFIKSIYEGDVVEKTVIVVENGEMKCLEGQLRAEFYTKYH